MWAKIAKPDQIIIFTSSSLSPWLCEKSVWYYWSSFTDTECPVVRNIKPQNNLPVRLFTLYWTRLVLVLYTNAKRSPQNIIHTVKNAPALQTPTSHFINKYFELEVNLGWTNTSKPTKKLTKHPVLRLEPQYFL